MNLPVTEKISMSENVDSALKILLARKPSDKARIELASRPADSLVYGILLSDEFHEKILTPLKEADTFLHDAKKVQLTRDDVQWITAYLPLSSFFRDKLPTVENWRDLYEILLRDKVIRDNLKKLYPTHKHLPRFTATADAIAEVLVARRKSGDVGIKAAPVPLPAAKPATPVKMPVVTKGATVAKMIAPAETTAKKPVAKTSEDAPDKVLFANPADELVEARELLSSLRGNDSFESLRGKLFKYFGKAQGVGLVWIETQIAEEPLADAYLQYFVRFMVSRVYLRHFMNETCFNLVAELVADKTHLKRLSDFDRSRLLRTYFLSAMRSGRADLAVKCYRDAMVRYPSEWEYYYQVADTIAFQSPQEAMDLYDYALKLGPTMNPANRISMADFFAQEGRIKEAMLILLGVLKDTNINNDAYLALANIALLQGNREVWTAHVSTYFEKQGLSAADFAVPDAKGLFAFGQVLSDKRADHPKVTIVMTSFNASDTLGAAIASIQNQTCANFELIIVDDCSSDGTRALIRKAAAADPRISFIFNDVNMGTYCSKNKGVLMATGEYVTFHDSDDWMHPARLERHLDAMTHGLQATISSWVRMRADGFTVTRKGGGYLHRNPASTFIRKSVFDEIGLFDSVRTGADTEMLWRIKNRYGLTSVKELQDTLALGLQRDDSLTTAGVAAFDEYRFSPVRLRYAESWVRTHFTDMIKGQIEYMPYPHRERAFAAPEEIAVSVFDT